MAFPIIAPLIAAGASSLLQAGFGIADMIKGKKTLNKAQSFYEENKFQIPEGAKAALGVAERQASSMALPGEDILRARLGESTAQGIGTAQQVGTSSSDVLAMLASLSASQMAGEQNIALSGAERYDRNQAGLRDELSRMSDLEQKRWEYNVLYPYQQQLMQAEQYSTRGRQGLSAGLSSLGQMAGDVFKVNSAQNNHNDLLAGMGFTMGDINPQNKMSYMQPKQASLNTNLNTNQLR